MNKTLLALTTAIALGTSGTVLAGCGFYHYNASDDRGHSQYGESAKGKMVKTGGYAASHITGPDIVDTAVAAGSFSTLVKAVQAAGLVDTLKSEGPFTVFAPTDEAFAKLPPGTVEALLADRDKLAQVLKYHVVPGKLAASDVTGMTDLDTVQGTKLPVGTLQISATDIVTVNGIIHVIDEVLIPQS